MNMIPLALYIHIPWCIKKCPYCDFNSHVIKTSIPQRSYIDALIRDFGNDLQHIHNGTLISIFIGGGTPSLFEPGLIAQLLQAINQRFAINNIEITLEANPGTIEQKRFESFRQAGINRISLGIQSLHDDKLQQLGRIHSSNEAIAAITAAKNAGFTNINCDLMFGLPNQSIEQAINDLEQIITLNPQHISWYQLTIEPNTLFHYKPPVLPIDEIIWQMEQQGQQLLADNNYQQYEVSAYAKQNFHCQHNVNYWEFGDYMGIGAGAHGKITHPETHKITRYWKIKHPDNYLLAKNFYGHKKTVPENESAFEFMLNALRLQKPIPVDLFTERTHLSIDRIRKTLLNAQEKKFLLFYDNNIKLTNLGKRFLNTVIEMFL